MAFAGDVENTRQLTSCVVNRGRGAVHGHDAREKVLSTQNRSDFSSLEHQTWGGGASTFFRQMDTDPVRLWNDDRLRISVTGGGNQQPRGIGQNS